MTRLERNNLFWGYLFLGPNIIYLIFWTFLPILFAFLLSFTNYDMLQHDIMKGFQSGAKFVGLKNYMLVLKNPIFVRSV